MITNVLIGILGEMPDMELIEENEIARNRQIDSNVAVDRFCVKCGIVGKCSQCQKCGEFFDSRCGKMVKHVCKFCRSKCDSQPTFCPICKGQKELQQCSGCQQFFHPLCVKEAISGKRSCKLDKLCGRCIKVMQSVPKSLIRNKGSVCQICNKAGLVVKCSSCDRFYHSFCAEYRDFGKGWHCGHCMNRMCAVCGCPVFNGSSVIQCKGRKNSCRQYFHTVGSEWLDELRRSALSRFLGKRLCVTVAKRSEKGLSIAVSNDLGF